MYKLTIKPSALKEIKRLAERAKSRVKKAIERLMSEPRPRGVRKIVGGDDIFRLRVGDYRVIYHIDDAERKIRIIAIRKRDEVYR